MCFPGNCPKPGVWSLLLILLSTVTGLHGAESLESVQESARKWVDLRLETSRLEADWAWQKELLQSMEDTLGLKVRQLEEKEALLQARTASQSEQVEKSREQASQLRIELEEVEGHIQVIVEDLQNVRAFLPPSLSNSLELAYTSLNEPGLSLGEKMQLVVTVLNRCQQFNGMISYREEIVPTQDKEKVLSVIYWGLSHAYALDRKTGDTFLGKPAEEGWTWIPRPGMKSEVSRLISIFNEEIDPELVKAPVQVNPPKLW